MAKLLADQNFNGNVVRGLLRRQPDLDLVRTQDAGLSRMSDSDLLEWAAQRGRIVLTHDRNTLTGDAIHRIAAGLPMPGIFVVNDQAAIGELIEHILLACECGQPDEWEGQLLYLPL